MGLRVIQKVTWPIGAKEASSVNPNSPLQIVQRGLARGM